MNRRRFKFVRLNVFTLLFGVLILLSVVWILSGWLGVRLDIRLRMSINSIAFIAHEGSLGLVWWPPATWSPADVITFAFDHKPRYSHLTSNDVEIGALGFYFGRPTVNPYRWI